MSYINDVELMLRKFPLYELNVLDRDADVALGTAVEHCDLHS
jgi:hypothetical protein